MGANTRRTASVVWELSEEGTVVVDVDAPVRPFGGVPFTPPRGTLVRDDALDALDALDDPMADLATDDAGRDRDGSRDGKRRTLPPLPAR